MSVLKIIRGPSGSGKSTIARAIIANSTEPFDWFEADQFLIDRVLGEYIWTPKRLRVAHQLCYENTEHSMSQGRNVIVSNTSTRLREIEPYLELAKRYHYTVEIIRTPSPWVPEILVKRAVHGTPIETIRKQINRYSLLLEETVYEKPIGTNE